MFNTLPAVISASKVVESVTLAGELWELPDTPHDLDDEFEGSVIDPAWDSGVALDYVTPIDPYAVGGNLGNINDTHPSWLMVQGTCVYSKAFPGGLPTNCLIYARMRWARETVDANGRSNHYIWFGASSGGQYDNNGQLSVAITEWLSGEYAEGFYRSGGSFPRWGPNTVSMNNEGTALEWVGIQKLGTQYHGWVWGNGGNRFYLGALNSAFVPGTLDRVGFTMSGDLANPGRIVSGIDCFRVVESAVFLP
jgi:hypothetical protein